MTCAEGTTNGRGFRVPLGLYLDYFQRQFPFSFPNTITNGPDFTCDLVSSNGNGIPDSAQIFISQGFRLVRKGNNSLYFEYTAFADDESDECVDLFSLDGHLRRDANLYPQSIDGDRLRQNQGLMNKLFGQPQEVIGVYIETTRGRRYGVWYEFKSGKLIDVGYEDNDFFYDKETGIVDGNGELIVERDEWPNISFAYRDFAQIVHKK